MRNIANLHQPAYEFLRENIVRQIWSEREIHQLFSSALGENSLIALHELLEANENCLSALDGKVFLVNTDFGIKPVEYHIDLVFIDNFLKNGALNPADYVVKLELETDIAKEFF